MKANLRLINKSRRFSDEFKKALVSEFEKGHRIRIEVSSSNFPRFDRNMNTGGNTYDETKGIVANNSIHHGGKFQSKIVLPIVKK